jgi:hypothetical protein
MVRIAAAGYMGEAAGGGPPTSVVVRQNRVRSA